MTQVENETRIWKIEFAETAPKDGRRVRLFAKWAPPEGLICRWQYHPGTNSIGWVDESGAGLAVFDWTGWEPVDQITA